MTASKKPWLRIQFHGELPQWIIESDIAAYNPHRNKIYIKRGLGWKFWDSNWSMPGRMLHELCHWAICRLGLPAALHQRLDSR